MQFYWSESEVNGPKDGCESLAPFVMALFDGEASEDQAKRARAHLLVCQSCAHRWLDWNRSRDLLRNIEVPAPPPTLLWRVLMACRLASFSSKAASKSAPVAPRQNYNGAAGAPDSLQAQILARTTRGAAYSAAAYSDSARSSVSKKTRAYPNLAMPALAVPALAMFLMVSQGSALFLPQAPDTDAYELTSQAAEQTDVPVLKHIRAAVVHAKPHLRKLAVTAPVIHNEQDVAIVEEDAPRVNEARVEHSHEIVRESRQARVLDTRDDAPVQQNAVVVTDAGPSGGVRLASMERPAPRAVSEPEMELPVARPRVLSAVFTPASLSDKKKAPRLRTAHWELATPRVTHIVETAADEKQSMRVSLPTTRSVAPAPAKLLAENFESDDARVDEVRSVVDDFRATLAPPASSSGTTDSDLDEPAG